MWNKMKVLVLGVGAVGSIIAEVLSKQQEFEEVIVADIKKERAQKVVERIGSSKARAVSMNADDVEQMKAGMKDVDLVINAVLPRFFLKIMQAALESGTNYMDMATDLGVAAHEKPGDRITKVPIDLQIEQDQKWKDAGLTALLSWGNDPGASNVYARYAANRMDTVEEVNIRDGDNVVIEGFDGLVSLWSPDTLIEEVALMNALIWTDGRFERVESMSKYDYFDFPEPMGKLKVWAVDHEEQETLGKTIGKGCRECNFMIALSDDTINILRVLRKIGMVRPEPVQVNGTKVYPRDVVTALMPSPTDPNIQKNARGKACIGTEVIGMKNGKRISHFIYQMSDYEDIYRRFGVTVTAWQTGMPPAIAAIMLARGEIDKKGAYPPEMLDPEPILKRFNDFGFTWKERIRELS